MGVLREGFRTMEGSDDNLQDIRGNYIHAQI